jgi:hypothetical protein
MNEDIFAHPQLILPSRHDAAYVDVLIVNNDGASFRGMNLTNLGELSNIMRGRAIRYSYVWFKGVRFVLFSSRASPDKFDKRVSLSYGPDVSKGNVVYGPVIIAGCADEETVRSLTEFEMDLLWGCIRCLTVNRKTQNEPVMELTMRICFAENHPTSVSFIEVDEPVETPPSQEEVVFNSV